MIRCLILLSLSSFLPTFAQAGEQAAQLPHAAEQKTWETIVSRFSGTPTSERNRSGQLQRVEVEHLKTDKGGEGICTLTLDPATGHVLEVTANRAAFTNEEFALFANFPELKKLTLWHNSNFHNREIPLSEFDASGLKALTELPKLERVTLAGGGFGDEGMRAAAQLKSLKYLGMWHVEVTDDGMKHIEQHPNLNEIRLGPFWGKKMTGETLKSLATCPKIETIAIGETWLTYEDGLKHLLPAKGTLKTLDLTNTLIEPAHVDRLKQELPETKITWEGLQGAGKILKESGWHLGKARKWMPEALIERALAAAEESTGKAD